jgi:hypothetical protein
VKHDPVAVELVDPNELAKRRAPFIFDARVDVEGAGREPRLDASLCLATPLPASTT